MRKHNRVILFFLFVALIFLGTTNSYGAYSAESKTVNSGESFSVTVTSSDALEAYNLDLSGYEGLTFNGCLIPEGGTLSDKNDNGSIAYINVSGTTNTLGTYQFSAPEVTEDTTYIIQFLVDKETPVTSNITVKANSAPTEEPTEEPIEEPIEEPTEEPTQEQNPDVPETPAKSSNTNLRNLGIRPNDFTGFKPWITSYTVTNVPNDVTTIEVYAYKSEDGQTISGTGKKSLDEGTNRFPVTVTAEDGTQKTYTITVIRLASEEINNPDVEQAPEVKPGLTSLSIDGITLNEPFSPDKQEYTAVLEKDIESTTVNAVANIEGAVIEIEGEDNLSGENSIITVKVKNTDGSEEKTYTINITKKIQEPQENENENNIATIVGSSNNSSGKGKIGMEKILFCLGIAIIAALGVIFTIIKYKRDNGDYEEINTIDYVGNVNPIEAIKDASSATSRLSEVNEETIKETAGIPRKKGRHF